MLCVGKGYVINKKLQILSHFEKIDFPEYYSPVKPVDSIKNFPFKFAAGNEKMFGKLPDLEWDKLTLNCGSLKGCKLCLERLLNTGENHRLVRQLQHFTSVKTENNNYNYNTNLCVYTTMKLKVES